MKLSEVDEWSNKDVTVEHLFKVQAARALEFIRYFNALMKQYPTWTKSRGLTGAYIFDHSSYLSNRTLFRTNVSDAETLPLDAVEKLCKLRDRMINAKYKFENADGDYDNFKQYFFPYNYM